MNTLEERRLEFEKLFIEDECIVSAMRYFIDDDTSQAVKEYDKIKKGQKKLWQWFKLQLEEEREEAYKHVASWFKFPYRKGMEMTKYIDGTGGLVNVGCEVCGGKLVYIRGKRPGDKKRKVCSTCAVEILEGLYSNLSNREGSTLKNSKGGKQK